MRLLRRKTADPRLQAARVHHAAGDFAAARTLASQAVADGDTTFDAVRGLAELEYLLGDYAAAEGHLEQALEATGRKAGRRIDAELALALVYLQTNRFGEAQGLFAGARDDVNVPVWKLMTSFGDERPYRIDWGGRAEVDLPLLQETTWELPCIGLEVDGVEVDARLDTGGELLTLTPGVAETVGLEAVAVAEGTFAAGARAQVRYGRVDGVRLGPLSVESVPVAVVPLDRPVVGTGFLHQFLATLDYPARRLELRPRSPNASHAGVEVPFALALTHLVLARGTLDGSGPLTFLVDSGLEDEGGASFAAPRATLDAVGIPLPELTEEIGESGAGRLSQRFGRFPVGRLALGSLVQEDASGLYGVFPEEWTELTGISLHGIVSHGFLRPYAWTLDFDAMTMAFASPESH